jgi:hypothetical protein
MEISNIRVGVEKRVKVWTRVAGKNRTKNVQYFPIQDLVVDDEISLFGIFLPRYSSYSTL